MLIARFTARDPFRTSGIIEWPMPADIRSFEDLERFVPQAAGGAGLDPEKPRCRFWPPAPGFIEFHILNRLGDFPDKRCTRILD
jgi:hypothetical protein